MAAIPPLAGLATYAQAAQAGLSVDETVRRLLRFAWIEKRMMEAGLYWINPTPEWELKTAFSLHVHLDSEHAGLFRKRVSELRHPVPRMDISPDPSLEAFLEELLWAQDSVEKIAGLYVVLKPALLDAYQAHYAEAHPIVDHPTRRCLAIVIREEEEAVAWGRAALNALLESEDARARAEVWMNHLRAFLAAAGGIDGKSRCGDMDLPQKRAVKPYQPDYFPRRDARFTKADVFDFPPHRVIRDSQGVMVEGYTAEERTLALMAKRALEMDVPEMMSRIIAELKEQPWEYYMDMCRQLWDEARHALMGEIYFESMGLDWRALMAIHAGLPIVANLYMTPIESHAWLWSIEQGLMQRATGKRHEFELAEQARDPLAALFQDFDWADEVLHVRLGRRWLLENFNLTREQIEGEAWQRKRQAARDKLANHIDPARQVSWWPEFVFTALGVQSALKETLPAGNAQPPPDKEWASG